MLIRFQAADSDGDAAAHVVELDGAAAVGDLAARAAEVLQIRRDGVLLRVDGRVLSDRTRLRDAGLRPDSTVLVYPYAGTGEGRAALRAGAEKEAQWAEYDRRMQDYCATLQGKLTRAQEESRRKNADFERVRGERDQAIQERDEALQERAQAQNADFERVRGERDQAIQERDEALQERAQARGQLRHARTTREGLRRAKATAQEELQRMSEDIGRVRGERDEARGELRGTQTTLEEVRREKATAQQLADEQMAAERDAARLLQDQLDQLQQEAGAMRARLGDLEDGKRADAEEKRHLADRLHEAERRCTELGSQCTGARRDADRAQQQLAEVREHLARLGEELQAEARRSREQVEELDAARRDQAAANAEIDSQRTRLQRLQDELSAVSADRARISRDLEQVQGISEELEACRLERRRLQEQVAQLEAEAAVREQGWADGLRLAEDGCERLRRESGELKAAGAELREELRRVLGVAAGEAEQLRSQLGEAQAGAERSAADAQEQRAALQKACEERDRARRELGDSRRAQHATAQALEKRLDELRAQMRSCAEEQSVHQEELQRMSANLERTQEELDRARTERDEALRRQEQVEAESARMLERLGSSDWVGLFAPAAASRPAPEQPPRQQPQGEAPRPGSPEDDRIAKIMRMPADVRALRADLGLGRPRSPPSRQ
eukprot:TRINITY_DN7745_c0_g1_i17.p1 TRINITY_DN7745_c0_g1~~TRINITY_DN7745_c0_g1_i17.p1  ORF type:complete len:703 (+),score=245.75 TRINITY_DN7745_c0_g1_i17:87-2111(+)